MDLYLNIAYKYKVNSEEKYIKIITCEINSDKN